MSSEVSFKLLCAFLRASFPLPAACLGKHIHCRERQLVNIAPPIVLCLGSYASLHLTPLRAIHRVNNQHNANTRLYNPIRTLP